MCLIVLNAHGFSTIVHRTLDTCTMDSYNPIYSKVEDR